MRRSATGLVLLWWWAAPAVADALRPLPSACGDTPAAEAHTERAWNEHYLGIYENLWLGDVEAARVRACAALRIAAGFGPRDWRFAEALDELGRLEYLRGNDDGSIAAQAAAVAEMLLAKGPRAPEAQLYAHRLTLPLRRSGRSAQAAVVADEPYRVFTDGLVSVDRRLARRLDWLVSEYLAIERIDVARRLQQLIAQATPPDR